MAGHTTVLLREAVASLELAPDDVVVDATVGGAGHFKELLSALGSKGTLIGIDADEDAIKRGQEVLDSEKGNKPTVHLVENNFRNLSSILDDLEIPTITKSLFDLGWSGYQLARGRGFSFQENEPLFMTYGDPEKMQTAADVLNGESEEQIADIIYEFGEEHFSRGIAKAIVEMRNHERLTTTFQLVEAVKKGTPVWYHRRRINPATKTFQALRMYVNDELGALQDGLNAALERTSPGGRIAVITFHSIEDRIVKNMFRDLAKEGKGTVGTKKPINPAKTQ